MEVDSANNLTIKQFFVKAHVNKKAAGSAYIETKGCKLSCEINGPSITGKRLENKDSLNINVKIQNSTVESLIDKAIGIDDFQKDKEDKVKRIELEETIKNIAENIILVDQYPNMEINFLFKVFESSTYLKQYLVLGLSMALLHSGVQTSSFLVPCSIIKTEKNELILD